MCITSYFDKLSTGVIPRDRHIIAIFLFYVKHYVYYVNYMSNQVDNPPSTTVELGGNALYKPEI